MRTRRRIALAGFAILAFAGSVARADDPDPLEQVRDALLTVSDVEATGIGPTTILVTWKSLSPLTTSFRVEVATDEAGPFAAPPRDQVLSTPSCTTFDARSPSEQIRCVTQLKVPSPADPLPRWIRVVPVLAVGVHGLPPPLPNIADIPIIEGRPSTPDPALLGPLAPTDVLCNGGGELACVNVNSVTISWKDNSDEQRFWILRGKGVLNPPFQRIADLPADRTSYSETLRDFSSLFHYRVVAVRQRDIPRIDGSFAHEQSTSICVDSGDPTDSEPKHFCDVQVETAPVPPPSDPSGLVCVFIPQSTARCTWVDKELTPGKTYIEEDGWFIEQTGADANFASRTATMTTRPASPGQGVVSWEDEALPPDTARCYRVRGYRFGPAFSAYTNISCLGSTPRAPSDLVATALSNAQVRLTWKDNSTSEIGFAIERCDGECTASSAGWVEIASPADVPANATTFVDGNTIGLHTYSYRVFAVNFSGRSPSSNIATVRTLPSPLPAPLNLTAIGQAHAILLNWNDIAGETGYRIEFKPPGFGFDWEFLATVGANVTTHLDTQSLGVNQTRCYRVRAFKDGDQVSDPSNEACATTLGPQPPDAAPSNVTAEPAAATSTDGKTDINDKVIHISWTDNATNETGFVVEYLAFPNLGCPQNNIVDAAFRTLAVVPAYRGPAGGTVHYFAHRLIPHSAYFFRVKAINDDGASAFGMANPFFDTAHQDVTACVQTYGPPKPIVVDPDEDADLKAVRCTFTVKAPVSGPDAVGGMLVYVNSTVPGSSVGHTDTLFVGFVPPGDHHGLDGQQRQTHEGHNHYVRDIGPGGGLEFVASNPQNAPAVLDGWKISYQFRHGFNYRIIVTAYAKDDPFWTSAVVERRDVRVLADCPVESEPVP